ncbi:solute carrier family 22 member 1 [Amyelois transitella]|uniref:solute carrier family 22 member 1 n=1 Tax=Amyelois transitella TaxID=680683 RepID=UPI00067DBC91|nr:solute carrier family 22 member 1 [Amyelois transitella]
METTPLDETKVTPFEDALTKTGNGLYNILLVAANSLILLAIIMDLFGFTLIVNVACDLRLTIAQKAILSSFPFISIIVVSFAWGYISDTKGRKFTLVVSLPTAFVLSCLCSLSPNWIVLGVLKFLSVCFSCAANSVTYTLVGESCIQRLRSKYMLLMSCLLLLGPAAGAVVAYLTTLLSFSLPIPALGINFTPWRLLIIIMSIPIGLGGVFIHFFHESPKFLANWDRNDEALKVLESIYRINHKGSLDEFQIKQIRLEDVQKKNKMSLTRAIYEQSAPLFRRPLLGQTLQLFYIVAIVYITNNTCVVWLPHILDLIKVALENEVSSGNVCAMITTHSTSAVNATVEHSAEAPVICLGHVEEKTALTIIITQGIYSFLNFIISCLPKHRKTILISMLCLSSVSGVAMNLTPEPISSVVLYLIFGCTCLCMGIMASLFVDLYPTSYRGMASCLSILVGRTSTFVGINVAGNLIFNHCYVTFYLWSVLVFTSVIAAWYLPPDKTKIIPTNV